jgi:hypothetical protein
MSSDDDRFFSPYADGTLPLWPPKEGFLQGGERSTEYRLHTGEGFVGVRQAIPVNDNAPPTTAAMPTVHATSSIQ